MQIVVNVKLRKPRTRETQATKVLKTPEKYPEIMPEPLWNNKQTVANLGGWQREVLDMIKSNSDYVAPTGKINSTGVLSVRGLSRPQDNKRRLVNIVRSTGRLVGRTFFLDVLKSTHPERFLILRGVPESLRFSEIAYIKRLSDEWNGDCVIFDVRKKCPIEQMIETLGAASRLSDCFNVWVFMDWWPEVHGDDLDPCWRFFQIASSIEDDLILTIKEVSSETMCLALGGQAKRTEQRRIVEQTNEEEKVVQRREPIQSTGSLREDTLIQLVDQITEAFQKQDWDGVVRASTVYDGCCEASIPERTGDDAEDSRAARREGQRNELVKVHRTIAGSNIQREGSEGATPGLD